MSMQCKLIFAFLLIALKAQIVIAELSDIRVEIKAHKSSVLLGEPVIIIATVTNSGQEEIQIIYHHAPALAYREMSTVDLRLGRDPDHMQPWRDKLRPLENVDNRRLAPGESIEIDLVMLFNSKDGFFATTPGKYWIAGRAGVIKDGKYGELVSDPVEFEVREPTPTDRSTWLWLDAHKEEYGRLVQIPWGAKPSENFLAECDRLCRESNTSYIEYLAYFLSRWYKEGPNKDAEKSIRYAEIAKTKATSEKIKTEAEKLLPPRPSNSNP